MGETSFYESCAVESVEKEEDQTKAFKMRRGVFVAGEFNGGVIPTRIHILPKPGKYSHATYGTVAVTKERNQEFCDNFNSEVYQRLIPIDLEHETLLSGACGYYEPGTATMEADGSASIAVRWEDRGQKALSEGRFYYFSPMWFDKWREPLSGKIYNNVLIGGALTTTPYFKDANLRPLYASELTHSEGPMEQEEEKEASSTCKECGATMGESGCPSCSKKANEHKGENNMSEEEKKEATPSVDPAAFSALQARFAEMEKQAKEQEEQLKKANEALIRHATEARNRMFSEIIRGTDAAGDGAKAFRGDASVHAQVLDAIYTVSGGNVEDEDSLFQKYVSEMRGIAEQFADNEKLTAGPSGTKKASTGGDPREKWTAEVAKVMSERKLSETEAYQIVAQEQPELYRAQYKASYVKKEND